MTGMLASVRSADEASVMLGAGVDILDLKDPGTGALGALHPDTLREIVRMVNGRVTVSATTGDLEYDPDVLRQAARFTGQCGVDIVKIGIFGHLGDPAPLRALAGLCRDGVRIVLVLFAELYGPPLPFKAVADAGIYGIMLDTRDKESGGLTRKLDREILRRFVDDARTAGLVTGLAGALTAADVPELAALGADYLGFRGALCRSGRRADTLDPEAVRHIRNLLPKMQN